MRRLRILYDFEAFSDQDRGGITRYVMELASRVAAEAEVQVYAGWHRSLVLRQHQPPWVIGRYLPPLANTGELRRHLNAWLTRRAISRFRPDIVHRTYCRHAGAYPGAHSTFVTLYDLTYFRFPELFPGGATVCCRTRRAATQADRVVCISQHTKADALSVLSLPAEKCAVIPLGVGSPPPATGPQLASRRPYLLFVGQRGGYKNFDLLLRVLAATAELASLSLLAFGGGRFTPAEVSTIQQLGLSGRVEWAQGGDELLAAAYANAACLVYPSLYEGFGLPLLEAMTHGCPVACSNASSLPEVGGDAVEYFDPEEPEAVARALRAVTEPSRRATLISAGRNRAEFFTWDRCAMETLKIYRSAFGGLRTPN